MLIACQKYFDFESALHMVLVFHRLSIRPKIFYKVFHRLFKNMSELNAIFTAKLSFLSNSVTQDTVWPKLFNLSLILKKTLPN